MQSGAKSQMRPSKVDPNLMKKIGSIDLDRLRAELCNRSLLHFVEEFWGECVADKFVMNWHIAEICAELQRAAELVINRQTKLHDLIINVPPGTSKSTLCSILFPAWLWARDPSLRIISGSYSGALSLELSMKSRQVVRSAKYKKYFPFVKIRDDQDNKGNFQTSKGGARYSTSTGATITGLHAHFIIIDDPQNPELANSPAERSRTNSWVTETLSTRKTDKEVSLTIVVQQRLHRDDVTGHILNRGRQGWYHLCLPATLTGKVKPTELASKYVNGLLDPRRLSLKALDNLRLDLGSRAFSAQMLQDPGDDRDSIIKQEWVKTIKVEEWEKIYNSRRPNIDFYLDTAYTDNQKNDPSAIVAVAKVDSTLYVIGAWHGWLEFPALIEQIKKFIIGFPNNAKSRVRIEPKASGKSIVQSLRSGTSILVSETAAPTKSKQERLISVSPQFEALRVVLVEGGWNVLITDELHINEPHHDDVRDCLVMAVEENLVLKSNYGKYNYL